MTSYVPTRENRGSVQSFGVAPKVLSDDGGAAVPGHDLRELIGEGGMGIVHCARQESLQRDVAVKIMTRENPEECDRFIREARVLAQLDHPNIVPVYDYGFDAEGRCFYTMKMVRGRTLKAILASVKGGAPVWTLERLLEVFRKVCDAMAFAHSRGVIHRDLKPDNIMVGEFGEVLVMDWGLAGEIKGPDAFVPRTTPGVPQLKRKCAIDSDVELTMEGEVLGTPQYMSPEQAHACCDLDERCDVYALGGILYSILTLRPPVRKGEVNEMLESVRTGKIEPFETAIPFKQTETIPWRIPTALAAVIRKAMALEREDRFVSAAALAEDVDAYLGGYATSAEEIRIFGQLWLLIKRHRTVSIAVLVLLVVSGGFFVELVDSEQRARESAQSARRTEALARESERVAKNNEAEARASMAQARISQADSAYSANDSEQMREALKAVPEDLHDMNWRYLNDRADERVAVPAWEGDGFLIGSAPHPTKPGIFATVTSPAKCRFFEFEARTGKVIHDFAYRDGWIRAIAYSPDQKLIALGRIMGAGISIHDVESGRELNFWKSEWVDSLAFLPDGKRLLQSDQNSCIMWDITNGEAVWKSPHGMTHLLTPSGDRVVSISSRNLRLLSAEDGTVLVTYPIREVLPIASSLSPDGGKVILTHVDGEISCVRLEDGSLVFATPAGDDGAIFRTGFSGDGKQIITVAAIRDSVQTVRIRDAATGRSLRTLRGGSGGLESMSIHPLSGDLLITGASSATWKLPQNSEPGWKVPEGKLAAGFFGGDEVFLAPTETSLAAIDLGTGAEVWNPMRIPTHNAATSADGSTGVAQLVTTDHPNRRDVGVFHAEGGKFSEGAVIRFGTDVGVLAVNGDGTRSGMSGTWGGLEAFRNDTGQQLPLMDQKDIAFAFGLAWHGSDSKRLIGIFNRFARRGMPGAEDWIMTWDTDTGKCVAAERNATPMHCLSTEPGGTRLAEAGDDKVVRIRDAKTLAVLSQFRAHDGPINVIAWNPKRPMIATGSADRSVRLWDAETGEMIKELHIGLREPEALYFSPSGKRLACVIPGEKTLVWEMP